MTPEHVRDGPERANTDASDHTLRVTIAERLADARELDLREVEVSVSDGEVTLEGRVHCEADRREVEAIAEVEGVRRMHNRLDVHERAHWTFL